MQDSAEDSFRGYPVVFGARPQQQSMSDSNVEYWGYVFRHDIVASLQKRQRLCYRRKGQRRSRTCARQDVRMSACSADKRDNVSVYVRMHMHVVRFRSHCFERAAVYHGRHLIEQVYALFALEKRHFIVMRREPE